MTIQICFSLFLRRIFDALKIYIISYVTLYKATHTCFIYKWHSMSFAWRSIVLFSFIFLEKCNSVLRKNHLAINLDSLMSVRDKRIAKKKKLRERIEKWQNIRETWEKNEKCTEVKRARRKSSVPAPLSLHWFVEFSVRWSASKRAFQLRMDPPVSDAYAHNARTSPSFRPLFLE